MKIFGYTIIKTSKLDNLRKYYRSIEENLANVIAGFADENNQLKDEIEVLQNEIKRLQHAIIQKDKEISKLKKQIKG